MDRRTVTIPRSWAWTVLMGSFVVVGVLVMVGVAMLRQGEDVAKLVQAQRRADLRAEAAASESAVADRERAAAAVDQLRRILEASIVAHDAQAQADHDAQMSRLAELIGRPVPTPRPVSPPAVARVAPRGGGSPAAPPTTARPVPKPAPVTPTTCVTRGKSDNCQKAR